MSGWRLTEKHNQPVWLLWDFFHWVIYRIQLFLFTCWWSFEDTALTQTHNLIIYNLSPLLFIFYTNSCTSSYPGRNLIKFTDDTTLVSLLQGNEKQLGPVLDEFIERCNESHLLLNTSKTKVMSIDFRKEPTSCLTTIRGQSIQSVTMYWTYSDKKGQQGLYFLKKVSFIWFWTHNV